jgi:hypothetical protein
MPIVSGFAISTLFCSGDKFLSTDYSPKNLIDAGSQNTQPICGTEQARHPRL